MKIKIQSEIDYGRILEVPEWTKSLVVNMRDHYVALDVDPEYVDMYERPLSPAFPVKRWFKEIVPFKVVKE